MGLDLDWESIWLLDMAANVAAQIAVHDAAVQVEEERGRGRARGATVMGRQMQATREASVMLGHTINKRGHQHQRSISIMSDYFDAIGDGEHIENDEHEYEYGFIFSTLAASKRTSSIGQEAMRDWHARTASPSPSPFPTPSQITENNHQNHITFSTTPASPPPTTEKSNTTELGTAMQQWHARTRLKRRATGRGMDIMASNFEFGPAEEWEGVLVGKMVQGWEESVLALVGVVVMFRLWLVDAFGGWV